MLPPQREAFLAALFETVSEVLALQAGASEFNLQTLIKNRQAEHDATCHPTLGEPEAAGSLLFTCKPSTLGEFSADERPCLKLK